MTDASRSQDPIAEQIADLDEGLSDPIEGPLAQGVWWWVLIRGILAIAFGVIALFQPSAALLAVVLVFGVYAIMDGIVEIMHGVSARRSGSKAWGWLIFAGIVSVIAGIVALVMPGIAAVVGTLLVLWMIVAYNLVHGVMVIGVAAKSERGRGWGIAAGLISIAFAIVLGMFVLIDPVFAGLAFIFAIGIYAIVFGAMLVIAAITTRAKKGAKAVVGA